MPIELRYVERKFLIWGKTYPEQSSRYIETVCSGGVTEEGNPTRLYPIPLRYLESEDQFKKYQWITCRVAKKPTDQRPESLHVEEGSIVCGELIKTSKNEWIERAHYLFRDPSWQFNTMEELHEAQEKDKTSLGIVTPREILKVEIVSRPTEDRLEFDEKGKKIRDKVELQKKQRKLFEDNLPPELKTLTYIANRIRVHWLCNSPDCKSHKMQILDWEVTEVQRKHGDQRALEIMKDYLNLNEYAIRFFLGNLHQHPQSFTIVGLWYPKKSNQGLLF